MSKINCPCGWQMSDVGWPSHYVRYFFTQTQYDNVPEGDEKAMSDLAHHHVREFWQCDHCGRVAFIQADNKIRWYKPEFPWPEYGEHSGDETMP